LSKVASTQIPVDAGNFGLIDARVAREIVALGERDRYLPGLRSWVGYKQRGIEVRRGERYDGQPRVSVMGLWRLAKTAIFSFSSFPLTIFYLIGYTSLAVFFMLGGFALYCKLFTSLAVPGWASNVLLESFFGAINALGICILGEYVIRIYDQVRGRPIYLVDRTSNMEPTKTVALPIEQTELADQDTSDTTVQELLEEAEALLAMATPQRELSAWTGSERRRGDNRNTAGSTEKVAQRTRKRRRRKSKQRRSE
jgi:dolichol-phosphate mannosyltransferase